MITRNECIAQLRQHTDELQSRFGGSSMVRFGSVARNEQREASDVDVCVEMSPRLYQFVELGLYLEKLLGCHVDVVRKHRNMNAFLRQEIEKDGVYVFK